MEYHSSENTLSLAERDFLDLMNHGDDFFKIELLRPAKSCYKKALELNIESEKVKQKIDQCNRLLAFELKVIRILVVIAAVLVLAFFILK